MRRIWLVLAFLLFAQQGAALHSVSHASPEKSAPFEKVCDLCLAYAAVVSGAGSGHSLFATPEATLDFPAASFPFSHPVTQLAFSSRAPPALL
jgi:hypothetical protein